MNEHDSERMKGMLEALGYAEAATREDAGLILFNTCSIRETADSRFMGHLGEAKRLKQLEDENRQLKHVVAELTLDNRALKAVVAKKW